MDIKVILIFLLICFQTVAKEKLKVMAIDTGVDKTNTLISHYIPNNYEYLDDVNGHGTGMAWLILQHACEEVEFYPCRFYNVPFYNDNLEKMVDCLEQANILDIDIINISAGGKQPSRVEKTWLTKFLKKKGRLVITAAGNEGQFLDEYPYYPASYKIEGIIGVGAIDPNTNRKRIWSNYAPWLRWEYGVAETFDLYYKLTIVSGTSVSCAVYTGKLVQKWCEKRRQNAIHSTGK